MNLYYNSLRFVSFAFFLTQMSLSFFPRRDSLIQRKLFHNFSKRWDGLLREVNQ